MNLENQVKFGKAKKNTGEDGCILDTKYLDKTRLIKKTNNVEKTPEKSLN